MTYDSVPDQEAAWPHPKPGQVLKLVEESCQNVTGPARKRVGRPVVLQESHLCMAVICGFVRGWYAQLDVWRLIGSERIGRFDPLRLSDQAIYKRLEQASTAMGRIFEQVSAWLRTRLAGLEERELASWASEVYAVDASTLDRLSHWLPWLRRPGLGEYEGLGGQITALLDVRRQQWVSVEFFPRAADHCQAHFSSVLSHVQKGMLLLFDRGYFSFERFDALTSQGIWWVSRYANEATYLISHVCYQGDSVLDAIVYLGKYRSDQAKYPVRLLQFWLHGRQYQYLTNVLDPHVLPFADVVKLYARRWDIELAFRLLKDHLRLNHLWSAKWSVIQVQLWCCLILAQVYHALQVEMAHQNGVEVFDVSIDLLVRLVPHWLAVGASPLSQAARVGRQIGLIRCSTRHRVEVPWIDPLWVTAPPPEAIQPRARASTGRPHRATGKKSTGRPKKAG